MRTPLTAAALAILFGGSALAQSPAPRETVSVAVGAKKVSIEYGRPSLKGRTFDELVQQLPSERIWRAGVNQVTTFSTEGDILVGDSKVPAGKYSLYLHVPEGGDCSLVLNSDLGVPLGKIWSEAPPNLANEPWPYLEDYQKNIGAKEVARTTMTRAPASTTVDLFTISLAPNKSGAVLMLSWGDRSFRVDLKPVAR